MERFDGHIMFTCGNNIIIYFFLITEQPTLPRLEIEPIFPFVLMKKFANLDPIFFFFRLSICVRHIIALCNRLKNYFINASYYYYWWLVIIIIVDTNICNSANKCVFYWVFFFADLLDEIGRSTPDQRVPDDDVGRPWSDSNQSRV